MASPTTTATSTGNPEPVAVALSIREFARRYGISEKTARALVHAGHVRAFRVGARILRVPVAECEAYARRALAGGV